MKKRILSILLCLVLMLGLLPTSALAALKLAQGEVSTWAELEQALLVRKEVKLVADITCPAGGAGLVIPYESTSYGYYVIDLNGYTLSRGLTSAKADGYVIKNCGNLIIQDTSALKSGKITGGWNTGSGGGIYCDGDDFCSLTVKDGVTICGNTSLESGGGIYGGSMPITVEKGATICHNTAKSGGGIRAGARSKIFGAVKNNSAENGGGIYTLGSVDLQSCEIANNKATEKGGGVYFSVSQNSGYITLYGADGVATKIIGNKAPDGGGLYAVGSTDSTNMNEAVGVGGTVIVKDNTKTGAGNASNMVFLNNMRLYVSAYGLNTDSELRITSSPAYFPIYDNKDNVISRPAQIKNDSGSSSGENGDPYTVVYYGRKDLSSIAWYLLPDTNHVYGNAYFLWSKNSLGNQNFEAVEKSSLSDDIMEWLTPTVEAMEWGDWLTLMDALAGKDSSSHTWWTSNARVWLNGDFYNSAFNVHEKRAILTTVQGSGNTVMSYNGTGISDKVFLLSADELISAKFGFANNLTVNAGYADPAKDPIDNNWYLMRTPYSDGPGWKNAVPGVISGGGTFYPNGVDAVISQEFGMRPGINLNKDYVAFLPPAVNIDQYVISSKLSPVSTNEFKVALKDCDTFAVTSQRMNGGKITFSYTGGVTDAYRYITAILTDDTDRIKYMGNIAEAKVSDTVTFDISNIEMQPGDRLYVCSNAQMGDKQVNFASNLVPLTTVEVHTVKAVSAAPACTSVGLARDCWYCEDCDTYFADENATTVLTDVKLAPVGHSWTTEYTAKNADDTKHYHVCTACGAKDEGEAHQYDANEICRICGKLPNYWTRLNAALSNAKDGDVIKLDRNIYCENPDDGSIIFSSTSARSVTLDLNGYTINGGALMAPTLDISSTGLSVIDSSRKSGKIIAGANWDGNIISYHGPLGGASFTGITVIGNGMEKGCGIASDISDATVYVTDCTIQSCGIGVSASSNLVMSGSAVTDCKIGVQQNARKLTISDSDIRRNGRGIDVSNASAVITGSDIRENATSGGIYFYAKYLSTNTLTIDDCVIRSNSTTGSGGGIFASGEASVTITNSLIERNTASANGGGIAADGMNLTISRCTIMRNTAGVTGGGVDFDGGYFRSSDTPFVFDLENSSVTGNSASLSGVGGVRVFVQNVESWDAYAPLTLESNLENVVEAEEEASVIIMDNYAGYPANASNLQISGKVLPLKFSTLYAGSYIGVRDESYEVGKAFLTGSLVDITVATGLPYIYSDVPCQKMKVVRKTPTSWKADLVWEGNSCTYGSEYTREDDTLHYRVCLACGSYGVEKHHFASATCTTPKTCTDCSATVGEPEHIWKWSDFKVEHADAEYHYSYCKLCNKRGSTKFAHVLDENRGPLDPIVCTECQYVISDPFLVYVADVLMTDKTYLAVGAAETTTAKPSSGGYAYFADGTLTLHNFTYTEQKYTGIRSQQDLNLVVEGTNSIHGYSYAIADYGNLTIFGSGTLDLSGRKSAVYVNSGDLTVNGGTITATASSETAFDVYDGDIIINDGNISATATVSDEDSGAALYASNIIFNGGTVVADGVDKGIYGGNVSFSNTDVTVKGAKYSLSCEDISVEDSRVTLTGCAIAEKLTVSSGTLEVVSGGILLYTFSGDFIPGTVTLGEGVSITKPEGGRVEQIPEQGYFSGETTQIVDAAGNIADAFIITDGKVSGAASFNGTGYPTLAAAIAAAEAAGGGTVQLLADATESMMMLSPGVTVDINGKTLTTDGAMSFGGYMVDNSADKSGKVICMNGMLMLDAANPDLLVWNGTDGYFFTEIEQVLTQVNSGSGSYKLTFLPRFTQIAKIAPLLADGNGGADHGVEIMVKLLWDGGEKELNYSDNMIKTVYSGNAFTLTLTGYQPFIALGLKLQVVVVSNGVTAASAPITVS